MRSRVLLVAIVMLAASGCGRPGVEPGTREQPPSRSSADETLARELEKLVDGLVRADEFSGAVLLSRRGQPLFRQAFGFADRETRRANTAETAFELASVSKMFTAVIVAQLAERNRIRFEQTIGSLLPDYPAGAPSAGVTVAQLLTMSSGIPDVFRSQEFFAEFPSAKALSDFYKHYATAPLEFPPGSRWAYSNSNFLILGSIIERTLGQPFAAVAEERVFRPAAMKRTTYRSNRVSDVALVYTRTRSKDDREWRPAWEKSSGEVSIVGVSLGGGISTVDDLARFAEALLDGRLLSPQMVQRVTAGYVPADYGGRHGYGFETRVVNGIRIAGHQGGFPGIANQVDIYPDLGYTLVVLGNTDAEGTQKIAGAVRALIGQSARPVPGAGPD